VFRADLQSDNRGFALVQPGTILSLQLSACYVLPRSLRLSSEITLIKTTRRCIKSARIR